MSWILAFIGFAILVILHELGHFTAAKAVGMRVEKFSLFFPPTLVSKKVGETEYAIGAIPAGGYVRITGMNPSEELSDERTLRGLVDLLRRAGALARAIERGVKVDRAARRYVAILREAGIPVESVRGPHGGYRLGRGLRLPPLVFSAAEALGLVMAVLDGRNAAADSADPVG